jgi:hypothetical protein
MADAIAQDSYLFDIRPAYRWYVWGRDSNLGQKTFAAPNPPAGAMIDYYLKSDAQGPVTITVTDASGKIIRTLRSLANRAGVNRALWDLRYDGPQQQGGPQGRGPGGRGAGQLPGGPQIPAEAAAEFIGRFGLGGGPYVLPGEYTVKIRLGGKELSKTVRVETDPRIKILRSDLEAQLKAALELRDLASTLNRVVARIDDLTQQLNSLAENLRKEPQEPVSGGNGMAQERRAGEMPEIKTALDELKKLRLTLVREAQFSYRYAPRLREEVNSLMGSVTNPIAAPTEPQMLRLREVTAETAKAVSDLNAIIDGQIKKINEKLQGRPHVMTGSPVR